MKTYACVCDDVNYPSSHTAWSTEEKALSTQSHLTTCYASRHKTGRVISAEGIEEKGQRIDYRHICCLHYIINLP